MAKFKVDDIRTVALVGHEVAGKTSLADALLYKAKAVDRRGSVDEGSSVSDYDEEEKKLKYSIDCHVLNFEYQGKHVYLLDAPGKPDFVGAALEALNAADNAVIVISATSGIQVNTRRMFQEAGKRGLARMLVVNRMDADNINFNGLLSAIQETFGKACVLFNATDAVGAKFSKVVSVLNPPASPAAGPVDITAARSKPHRGQRQPRGAQEGAAQGGGVGHGDSDLLHFGQERRRHRRAARGHQSICTLAGPGEAPQRHQGDR
jgi:elongation factor G